MDSSFPTAADYAQSAADRANRKLDRIEAALIKAGLLEPEPEPVFLGVSATAELLKAHYAAGWQEILDDDEKNPPDFSAFMKAPHG